MLLPVQSVGVMGDARTYESTIADPRRREPRRHDGRLGAAAARAARRISSRIVNEVRGVNRVVYDISLEAAVTIEWE